MTRPPLPPAPPAPPPTTAHRQPLTRERVLRAAIEIVDKEGVDALSMRRLGAELGVEAMSLYNHVPNKAAVLDGIVETVISDVDLPDDISDWKECIRFISRSYRKVAVAHPNVVPLISMRPFNTIASLRPVEVGFEILKQAGFEPKAAVHAFRTIAGFTSGYSLAESGSFFGEESDEALLSPDDLSPEEFPRLTEVAPYLATGHDEEFEFALDVIITGLEAKLPK